MGSYVEAAEASRWSVTAESKASLPDLGVFGELRDDRNTFGSKQSGTIGVGLTNLIKPGALMSEEDRTRLLSSYEGAAGDKVADAAELSQAVADGGRAITDDAFALDLLNIAVGVGDDPVA